MSAQAGKGSRRRPGDQEKYEAGYERVLALGCSPKQVPAWNRKYGHLGVKFHPVTGKAICRDRAAKRAFMQVRGMIDHDEIWTGKT